MGENLKLKGKMHNILCFVRKSDAWTPEPKSERLAAEFSRRVTQLVLENRVALIVVESGGGQARRRGTPWRNMEKPKVET
jgi:hypothetical protein